MLGEAIGRFRIQGRIGQGGLGEVWLAAHDETKHRVAIKLLRPEVSSLPVIPACFDEAQQAGRLSDSGIAKIFGTGIHRDGRAFVITEYLAGDSFAQRIAKGRMSSTQVADIVVQIARALATAQAAGIGHNNLKMTNLFLVPDGDRPSGERVVVLDFCMGRLVAASPGLGTLAYMAPEQLSGGTADVRTDTYALGCIAFELVCQRPPFVAKTYAELRDKHLREAPPSVRSFVPDVGGVVDKLIAKMLEKKPADRPRSLREVGKLFEMIVGFDAPLGETVKT